MSKELVRVVMNCSGCGRLIMDFRVWVDIDEGDLYCESCKLLIEFFDDSILIDDGQARL